MRVKHNADKYQGWSVQNQRSSLLRSTIDIFITLGTRNGLKLPMKITKKSIVIRFNDGLIKRRMIDKLTYTSRRSLMFHAIRCLIPCRKQVVGPFQSFEKLLPVSYPPLHLNLKHQHKHRLHHLKTLTM